MVINAVIDERNGYADLLKLLSNVPPFNTLKQREGEVLAEFIYWYNTYDDLSEDIRQTMTFDYKTKYQIMKKLDISTEQLNNYIYFLRKKGFIVGRSLKVKLPNLSKISDVAIDFKLKIKPYETDMVNDNSGSGTTI